MYADARIAMNPRSVNIQYDEDGFTFQANTKVLITDGLSVDFVIASKVFVPAKGDNTTISSEKWKIVSTGRMANASDYVALPTVTATQQCTSGCNQARDMTKSCQCDSKCWLFGDCCDTTCEAQGTSMNNYFESTAGILDYVTMTMVTTAYVNTSDIFTKKTPLPAGRCERSFSSCKLFFHRRSLLAEADIFA